MIVIVSRALKTLIALCASTDSLFLCRLSFELLYNLSQVNTGKMNDTVGLTNILIATIGNRTFYILLLLICIWMTSLDMKVKEALLNETHLTMRACVGQSTFMLLQMVMHR